MAKPLERCGFDAAFPTDSAIRAFDFNPPLAKGKDGKAASKPQRSKGFADAG
jgi:hypothetical protein